MRLATLLLFLLPLLTLSTRAAEPAAGTLLTYRGKMVADQDDGNPVQKEFELQVVVTASTAGGNQVQEMSWTLDETGRGRLPWTGHFGRWTVDPAERDDGSTGPALLYERADGKSVVPLPQLAFAAEENIERGKMWSEGKYDYRVTGEATKGGRACWEIDVRSAYGHKRTLWRELDSTRVVAVRETVFIGQGERHDLRLELIEAIDLSAAQFLKATAAFDAWLAARTEIGSDPRESRGEHSGEQLAKLRERLPALLAAATDTPLATVAKAAQQDAQNQQGRAGALAALGEKIIGKSVGEFKLNDLAGKAQTHERLAGKVTVLHFWEYRDTPLEEPYGQAGYLDFLLRQRADAGVQVIGIHVDAKLADEETRRASIAAARRFKTFMNLGYDVVLDDGKLLERVGDPRPASGKLPLFIVVGKDGKVLEYHAGLYEVHPNRGLQELDAVVQKALEMGK